MRRKKMPRSFYLRPALTVAEELLGLLLVRKSGGRRLVGRIVEVEAYLGSGDPASHSYRGRNRRNEVMFWRGGHLYVYFTYGMHFCCNVVTGMEGEGEAVLIRAVEPLEGIADMARNRREHTRLRHPEALCNGPAKVCQAFAISRKDNGTDLCGNTIWIASDPAAAGPVEVFTSRRVGIRKGRRHKWRFTIRHNPFVSRASPA